MTTHYLDKLKKGADKPTLTNCYVEKLPDDFDLDRFQRGQMVYQRNIGSCSFAMFNSLVTGLTVIQLLKVLVFTGESGTPAKALDRYEKTAAIVVQWHFGDIWNINSKARKYIQLVCGYHDGARTKITNANPPTDRTVYISQYDMSLVQCGFIGAIVMYPKQFGVRASESDLEDFVYCWRWIGYLLGIDDDNNICRNSLAEARAISHEIEDVLVYPALQEPPPNFNQMAKALTDGINLALCKLKLFTPEALSTFSLKIANKKPLSHTFLDRIRAGIYWLTVNLTYYLSCVRNLFNTVLVSFCEEIEKRINGNDTEDDQEKTAHCA